MVDYELSQAITEVMLAFVDELGLAEGSDPMVSGLNEEQVAALERLDAAHRRAQGKVTA